MNRYVLDENGQPVLEPDVLEWSKWMSKANRTLALTTIGAITVSTVFLGTDYNFFGRTQPPVLWETMAFGGSNDYTERYSDQEDAMHGHKRIVEMVENGLWVREIIGEGNV
jgi:hypothetical protein